MKILVFTHRLAVGGGKCDRAYRPLRDVHGHDVVLFATLGPMVKLAEEKGLRLLSAADACVHLSPDGPRGLSF